MGIRKLRNYSSRTFCSPSPGNHRVSDFEHRASGNLHPVTALAGRGENFELFSYGIFST